MFQLLILMLLGLLCPDQTNHNACQDKGGQVTTMDGNGDTGGETGNPPPNPNPPTPPPSGGINP